MAKNVKALRTISGCLSIWSQTSPAAIPIITYKTPQTGANKAAGGLKEGLINVGNQTSVPDCVTDPEMYPIAKQVPTTVAIFRYLFIRFNF